MERHQGPGGEAKDNRPFVNAIFYFDVARKGICAIIAPGWPRRRPQ